ncbi:MAG: hypothetical protein CR991_10990 [Proteobacteria bacterium]|nr:MAG: hypothetical protein CR991_10990 [Pseudomonadota bacterium]
MIVLRSVGKFFGLAGIRLGFVWAEEALLQRLAVLQDDWSVSHPARWAGKLALADTAWQKQQRARLITAGARLRNCLQTAYPRTEIQSSALFAYSAMANAREEYERLARQGVLVRYFSGQETLRFGLPQEESDWQRLEYALGNRGFVGRCRKLGSVNL